MGIDWVRFGRMHTERDRAQLRNWHFALLTSVLAAHVLTFDHLIRITRLSPTGGAVVSTPALRPTPASGEQLVDLARQHKGEPYVLGVFVPKNNPGWKGPWDCAEFVSWVTFQVTGRLYGCDRDFGDPSTADAFTGFWKRDATQLGEAVSIEKAARTAGAVVLRNPAPGAFGHVVISDGAGGTIEAHSPVDGVIEGSLAARRWSTGILLPGVEYADGPSFPLAAPPETVFRLTMPVMTGPVVRRIQSKLLASGFDPGVQDGEFGPHTQAAVVAFQLTHGLTPDGEVGPATATALGV